MNKTYDSAKQISIRLQKDYPQVKICHLNDLPLNYHPEQAAIDNADLPVNTVYASCCGGTSALTSKYIDELASKFGFAATRYKDDGFSTNFDLTKDETVIKFNLGNDGELKESDTKKYRQTPDGLWLATISYILADELAGWINGNDECKQPILTILDNFSFSLADVMNVYYDSVEALTGSSKR